MAGGTKIGNSWWLDADTRSHSICMAMRDNRQGGNPETLQTWHQRLGYLNKRDIERLQEAAIGVVIGTPKIPYNKIQYTGCLVGKDYRKISRILRKRATRRLEIIHTDTCGPMQLPGLVGGYAYFCVFVDEYSRYTWVYCLKNKDNIRQAFKEFHAIQQNFTGLRILILFGDNEQALLQHEFQAWLAGEGIQYYITQTYSPEQSGPAKNAIKQIVHKASSMMWAPRIPIGFWPEACRMATYLKNRSSHRSISCTPYEL